MNFNKNKVSPFLYHVLVYKKNGIGFLLYRTIKSIVLPFYTNRKQYDQELQFCLHSFLSFQKFCLKHQ